LFAQLVSKILNLCGPDPPTSQTDEQTTCDSRTVLGTAVHHAVKTMTCKSGWTDWDAIWELYSYRPSNHV